ncbi:hypothetical protein [Streptomyces sp. NBC_01768]|uniref:hypothetical protein n=1 Tax=Streptomyces sp. NBC_01768 TaxID=2975938 RepID=UPI002DDC069B|nr:hypothetical protein [Streptomyces sp. NBC_01768]WSC32228.1 hypothetical protein OG902_39195 [Streptomyces sp. NBC_01768]
MKTWRTGKAALFTAAFAAATGVLLAGCSGGDGGTAHAASPAPTPTPAESTAEVADKPLGEALERLAFQGTRSWSKDGGACQAAAARKAGMAEKMLTYIVKTNSDDAGAAIKGLSKVSNGDAALLVSRSLREDFDACVDKAVLPDGGGAQDYEPPKAAAKPAVGRPDLRPAFAIRADQPVNWPTELTKGLVSMFSSYARDENQKKTYAAAGACLSRLVYDAGFSQEALHFLAGGAPIGTGSIAEHLPSTKDKTIWRSPEFTQGLVDCTTNATPAA